VDADKVQSLTDSMEKERKLRLSAEQHAQDVSQRMEVLSGYFNEKEKEFDRYLTLLITVIYYYFCHNFIFSPVMEIFLFAVIVDCNTLHPFSALTLLVWRQERQPVCKKYCHNSPQKLTLGGRSNLK